LLIRRAIQAADVNAELHVVRDGHSAAQFFDLTDSDNSAPCPDLVLLDLNLPKKNGEDVLRRLRSSAKCGRTLVLVVTSSDSARDREPVAALGIAGYFKKPSEYAEFMKLGSIVKRLLEETTPSADAE